MSSSDRNADGRLELISFEIAGQEFCIDIRSVREIRGWTPATPMPQTPTYMLGVINLRGSIMPVLDLRARLDLGATEASSRHVIVVVQHGDRLAGLLVDAVRETFVIDESVVQDPPDSDLAGNERFIDAIFALDGRMLSRLVVSVLLPQAGQMAA